MIWNHVEWWGFNWKTGLRGGVIIWIRLFYFYRAFCHWEGCHWEGWYSNVVMKALRAASSGNRTELEISKLFEAPYVDSPASRFWGFFLVIYFGFVDTSDIKRTLSGLWNGRTPQTDWDKRTRFYRDPCVWLGLSEIFAKSQHHFKTLQQNSFKTSQKIVFLATLLNRLFSSNNVIRIDLKKKNFWLKLGL